MRAQKTQPASAIVLLSILAVASVASTLIVVPALRARQAPGQKALGRTGRPVIFVGLDGADWQMLDDYLAGGAMPNLARLAREGRSGVLLTLHPPLSPLVWTTMMTGVGPLEHGILDFTRFNASTGIKEPITGDERAVPAVWNMATFRGKKVGVFGLWATYPAEAVKGVIVSDRLFSFQYAETHPPAGAIFPASRQGWALGLLRRAEESVGYSALKGYLPWIGEEEYRSLTSRDDPYSHPASALRRILIETRVYHDLARSWIAEGGADLAIVYLQGTDTIGHVFAPYVPPKQEGIPAADFERYSGVPERYFRWIDQLLGEYRQMAEAAGAVLMVASDHGFRWKAGRPVSMSSLAASTAGKWHRDEGIYLMWGPGILPETVRGQGSVVQVCGTLIALLGMPPGKRVAEPPLPGVKPTELGPVDYRAAIPPRPVEVAASQANQEPPAAGTMQREHPETDELQKLEALGYIGRAEPSKAPPEARASHSTRTPGSYNNAGLILEEQGRLGEAKEAFEKAIALDPHLASALWNLSDLLFRKERDIERSDELLLRSAAGGNPQGIQHIAGRAMAYQHSGRAERCLALLEKAVSLLPDEAELRLFRGRYRSERGDCRGALADAEQAERLAPANPLAYASAGVSRLCLGDREGAMKDFRRSLELDPDQPELRRYMNE